VQAVLKQQQVISADFTGSITLHFNQGGLTGAERVDKKIL
jgi:hypothetical protein